MNKNITIVIIIGIIIVIGAMAFGFSGLVKRQIHPLGAVAVRPAADVSGAAVCARVGAADVDVLADAFRGSDPIGEVRVVADLEGKRAVTYRAAAVVQDAPASGDRLGDRRRGADIASFQAHGHGDIRPRHVHRPGPCSFGRRWQPA